MDSTFPTDYPDTFQKAVVWLVCEFSTHTQYESLSDIQQCYVETQAIVVSRTWLPDFGSRSRREPRRRRENLAEARSTWKADGAVSEDAVPLLVQFYVQTTTSSGGAEIIDILDGSYVVGALAAAPPSLAKDSFLFKVVQGTTVEGKFAGRWGLTTTQQTDAITTRTTTLASDGVASTPGSTNSSKTQGDPNNSSLDTTKIGLIVSIVAVVLLVVVGAFIYHMRRKNGATFSDSQLADLQKRTGIVLNRNDFGPDKDYINVGLPSAMSNQHTDWAQTHGALNQLAGAGSGTMSDAFAVGAVPAGATWEDVAAVLSGAGAGQRISPPLADADSRVNLMPPLGNGEPRMQRWDRSSPLLQGQEEWATVAQALATSTTAGSTAGGVLPQTHLPSVQGSALADVAAFVPSNEDDAAADAEMQRTVTWANEVDAEARTRAVTAWGARAAREGVDGNMYGGSVSVGLRSATAWDEDLNNELMNFQKAASVGPQLKRTSSMTSVRDMDAIDHFVPTLIEQQRQDGYITAGPFSDGRSTVMSDGGYLDTVMYPMGRAAGGGSSMSVNGYLSTMPTNPSGFASPVNSSGGYLTGGAPSPASNTYPSGRPKQSAAPQAPPDAGHLQLLLNMRDMCDTNMSTANDPQARVMARQARDGIDKQLIELRSSPTESSHTHYHPPASAVTGSGVPYVVPVSRSEQQQQMQMQQQQRRSVTPHHQFISGNNRM